MIRVITRPWRSSRLPRRLLLQFALIGAAQNVGKAFLAISRPVGTVRATDRNRPKEVTGANAAGASVPISCAPGRPHRSILAFAVNPHVIQTQNHFLDYDACDS